MEQDLLLPTASKPETSFISNVFNYDVNKLEQTDSRYISKCIIALSQYLIYFKSKYNEKKVKLYQRQRLLEASLFHIITPDVISKYKTKKDARLKMIYSNASLNAIQMEIEVIQDELYLLDGIDKTISELIAAFKRELTRRDNELYQRRHIN